MCTGLYKDDKGRFNLGFINLQFRIYPAPTGTPSLIHYIDYILLEMAYLEVPFLLQSSIDSAFLQYYT